MSKRIEMIDKKFGRLTVKEMIRTKRGLSYLCQCDCGKKTTVSGYGLRSGHTKSCGCLQKELSSEKFKNNTWCRGFDDPKLASAKRVWKSTYIDGCSFETFLKLSNQLCFYCNCEPKNIYNAYMTKVGKFKNTSVNKEWAQNAYFKYQGLDRWDSNKNHSENNIVPSCFQCNAAKHNYTADEFVSWLSRLANNFVEKEILKLNGEKLENNIKDNSDILLKLIEEIQKKKAEK